MTKLSRRAVIKYAGAAALAVACSPSAPGAVSTPGATQKLGSSGKPLVVATVGGTFKDWQTECFTDPFTRETGVNVVSDVQTPVTVISTMVGAKRANQTPQHHVTKVDQFDVDFVTDQGLVTKIDKARVPNWQRIHPNFRTDSWISITFASWVPAWNTDKVKKNVTSWFDMWDDSFKGRTTLPAFEWSGFFFLAAINTALGGTPENVNPGFAKIKEVADNLEPKFITSVEHGIQLLETGEAWFAPFFPDGRVRNLQDKKVPIAMTYPKEGAVVSGAGWVINRALAENEAEANAYLNKMGDRDAQLCFASKINLPPTNTDVVLPASMERLKVKPDDLDRALRVPWGGYQARKDQYLDRWNREIRRG